MGTNLNVTYSSELMQNYLQAEVVSPQKNFEALQTGDGLTLLFAIGTDDVFYLIEQKSAHKIGWEKIDLSSLLSPDYGNSAIIAKNFAVAQNVSTGNIDISLAITVDGQDYLYLSLNNENNCGAITQETINWVIMPYDDQEHSGIELDIEDLYISETSDQEYVVADISQSTFDPGNNYILRYYIDPNKTNGYIWNAMVVGADLDPPAISCLGRKGGDSVDGMYTLGSNNGETELTYIQLYNPFGGAPFTTPLVAPQSATAISTVDAGNSLTDLYLAADKTLYYYDANKQSKDYAGELIFQNELFDGVSKLCSCATDDQIIVWGLNRDNQIFYTKCDKSRITDQTAWSTPVPILDEVDQFSPYINNKDDSIEFFAAAGNILTKAVQSPQTTIWKSQSINLQAPANAESTKISSYTTRIQLTDDNNKPIRDHLLNISTSARISFYINNLYYVLDTDPIPVRTDNMGSILIVETVDDLPGTKIIVSDDNTDPITINPMDNPMNQVAALNTASLVKATVITNPDGSTEPLIDQNTSDKDFSQVATYNVQLGDAYSDIAKANIDIGLSSTSSVRPLATYGAASSISADAGNLFKWLETGIEHEIDLVKDETSGLLNIVLTIADEVYSAVLDCEEKVIGAVRWIYNSVKTAVDDLIKYLEFLFEWQDIIRTKNVLKNLSVLYLQNAIDQIKDLQDDFDNEIKKLVQTINGWACINDWSGLGAAATAPANSSSNPSRGLSAPGTLLSNHFQNNSGNIKQQNPPPDPDPDQSLVSQLFDAMKSEETTLDNVIDQFRDLALEYEKLNLEVILEKITAIMADGVLESAQNVMDVFFDIIVDLSSECLAALDTPITIPILGDILDEIGISSFSILDLLCLITAVPVTLEYKLLNDTMPFEDDKYTDFLISASTFQDVIDAFKGIGSITIPDSVAKTVFIIGHISSGFFTLMSSIVSSLEAVEEDEDNPFSTPSGIIGMLNSVMLGITDTLVPKDPVKNEVVGWIDNITTFANILSALIFSGPAQKKFGASSGILNNLKADDGRATSSIVDTILLIPALCCTCWHLYELTEVDNDTAWTEAIIEETSNLTSAIATTSYAVAVNIADPSVKEVCIAVMAISDVATAGLQTAEAIVEAEDN
ncbi:MAG: hypothetical protein KKC46_01950 [Proteobacteria bacterium]|nr:hypothetical protein [Pseudomonadota bacterium]